MRQKINHLQHFAARGVVLHQTGTAFLVVMTVVSNNLPDGAVVPGYAVDPHPLRSLKERNEELRLPRGRIHPQNAAKTQRHNPQFAVLPKSAMTPAAIAGQAEGYLSMADDPRFHIHLINLETAFDG
jgi:hypothetical protein